MSAKALAGAFAFAIAALLATQGVAQAKTFAGLVPDESTTGARSSAIMRSPESLAARALAANLPYGGGPVLHSNRTHLIFWAPAHSGLAFDPGYTELVTRFMSQVAAASHSPSNVYGLTGQYADSTGPAAYDSSYRGSVLDADPLPANGCTELRDGGPGWTVCLNDAQLEHEIDHVISADGLPHSSTDIYFLITPNGFGSCLTVKSTSCALGGLAGGYCGYHSSTAQGTLYAVIPFNAVPGHCQAGNPRPNHSTADVAISALSHEHNEVITDPLGDAWIDAANNEDGDLCARQFGPRLGGSGAGAWNQSIAGGHYYLQEEWSNRSSGCELRSRRDPISFTVGVRAVPGGTLDFEASATHPVGRIISYAWSFADGRLGHGRDVAHVFKRAGAYRVVLRTTDSERNYAFVARMVTVLARPAGPAG
jgi:PKD domain